MKMTDDEYLRLHWRDPWLGGGPGKGTVNDAAIILFSETTSPDGKARLPGEACDIADSVGGCLAPSIDYKTTTDASRIAEIRREGGIE